MWIDDQVIERCRQKLVVSSWIPDEEIVVLGRSNNQEEEVYVDRCQQESVPILKRYGGGGTVLLSSGCVVVTVGAWVSHLYKNDMYFDILNQSLIESLQARFNDVSFRQRGYSDIVCGDRKFVGTSLFRSRNYLLYQASILVDADIDRVSHFLRHPSKEPDYRKSRDHREFLICLNELDPDFDSKECLSLLGRHLEGKVLKNLESEFIEPNVSHVPHLLKRIQ